MYTTKEAAALLGISIRRVLALIASGDLEATRFGSSWAISEASVKNRLETPRLKGRPKLGIKDPRLLKAYTLMNRNREVIDFNFKLSDLTVGEILTQKHLEFAPLGVFSKPGHVQAGNLGSWIRRRYIPLERPQLSAVLRKMHATSPAELLFETLGFNLSDQYWFRPVDSQVTWDELNYFNNNYTDELGLAMLEPGAAKLKNANLGPSAATPGMLLKWWEKKDGVDYLFKGGDVYEREPYNELLATRLYAALLEKDDYVAYHITQRNGQSYSVCPGFITPTTELVTMADVMTCYARTSERHDYKLYVQACLNLGIANIKEKLSKMIVCDFLTANADRHDQNLGLIRDVETLGWLGCAPLFDNGRAFYYSAGHSAEALTKGMLVYQSTPFSEYPTAQLSLAEDYRWFDAQRLEGFDDVIREVLSGNRHLTEEYIEGVAWQFNLRVQRVIEVAREHQ